MENRDVQPEVYKQGWFIILALIFFAPAGILLMWMFKKTWSKPAKVICSIIAAMIFISAIGSRNKAQNTSATTTPEITTVAYVKPTPEITPTIKPATTPETTTEATTTNQTTKATTNAATKPTTDATTEATTKETTIAYMLSMISMTTPISPGEIATIEISGKPNTEYDIDVYYSSAKSSAAGLENRTSNGTGYITWTWKVGINTNPGDYHIDIVGDGKKLVVNFTVR
jgi:hypothetical protein